MVLKDSSQLDHLQIMSDKKCPFQPLLTGNLIMLGVLKIGEGNEGLSEQCSIVDTDKGKLGISDREGFGVEQAVFTITSAEGVFGFDNKTLSSLLDTAQGIEEHFDTVFGFLNTEVT